MGLCENAWIVMCYNSTMLYLRGRAHYERTYVRTQNTEGKADKQLSIRIKIGTLRLASCGSPPTTYEAPSFRQKYI